MITPENLQDAYNFDDNRIYKITVTKKIVKKGKEYIDFNILEYNERITPQVT